MDIVFICHYVTIGKMRVILLIIGAIVTSVGNGKLLLWQNDPYFAYRLKLKPHASNDPGFVLHGSYMLSRHWFTFIHQIELRSTWTYFVTCSTWSEYTLGIYRYFL